MEKIPTIFIRDWEGNKALVTSQPDLLGAQWVFDGEGVATIKYDGTACMVRKGELYKRYEAKGSYYPDNDVWTPPTNLPADWEPAQPHCDFTGGWPGWVPVGEGPEDQYHREALYNTERLSAELGPLPLRSGTYELLGPKIQGNPEGLTRHLLVRHGTDRLEEVPTSFDGLRDYLEGNFIEGIVWHHSDGRMAKIKRRDFGLPWPVPEHLKQMQADIASAVHQALGNDRREERTQP